MSLTTDAEVLSAAHAVAEDEATRYGDLAESFAMHNNAEAAEAFAALAAEARAVAAALAAAGAGPAPAGFVWRDIEAEIEEQASLHYLMQPWHVVRLAVANQQRTLALFEGLAASCADAAVAVCTEQRRRLDELRCRLAETPEPPPGWDDDPDPPNYDM